MTTAEYEAEIARLRELVSTLYRRVEIIDGETAEPVQFVGCYVTRWGVAIEPTVAFVRYED